MKSVLLSLCVAFVLSTGCSTPHKSESESLQGTWIGREAGRNTEGTCSLVVTGNTIEFKGPAGNEWYKGTFVLHQHPEPKQVIAQIMECSIPEYVGRSSKAIYRLEGSELTLTGNEPGNPEVPAGFEAPGSRTFLLRKP